MRFNSNNPSKRGLFDKKMGFYSRKSPKTGLLKRGEVIFKSGAVLERIRYHVTFIEWTIKNVFLHRKKIVISIRNLVVPTYSIKYLTLICIILNKYEVITTF